MGNKEAWTDNLDKKIIETEENERRASIKMSNTDYNKKYAEILRKRLWARVAIVGVSLVILIIAMIITTSSNNITKDKLSNSVGNLMEISTLTDSLEYYPKNMTTELNGYMADLSIDVSDTIVQGYMSLDGYSYLGYLNEDQTVYTEIIVSRDIPNEIGLTDDTINELKKQNEIIYESSSESDYNKVVNKAAVNLYNIGYLFVIQQVDEEFSDYTFEDTMIENIIDTMLYEKISDKTENKTYIEFDSFGTFDLYDLDIDCSIGVYTDETGTLRIYDNDNEKDLFIITSISNDFIGEYTSQDNLTQRDGWNNLYDTLDASNSESDGYRGFAIQTARGMYFIQVDKSAANGLEDKIIDLLGILPDDDYIKPIFVEEETEG